MLTMLTLLSLVAGVAGAGPFAFVLAGIWILVAICRGYKRKAETDAVQPLVGASFRYNLCGFAVLYLIPMGIATTVYVLLSLYFTWYGDSMSIDSLVSMQRLFEKTSRFFSENVKLGEAGVFVILVAVFLSSCILLSKWRPDIGREKADVDLPTRWPSGRERAIALLHRLVDTYGKYSGPIAAGLATLASFTFFGMKLGEPSDDLRLRVKISQEGYAEVSKKAEAALSERVGSGLYTKVRDAFPESYQEALTLPTQIGEQVDNLRQSADETKAKHGIVIPAVQRSLRAEAARMQQVSELGRDLRVEGSGLRDVPGDLSFDQIQAARKALDSRERSAGFELIKVGHKKITLQTAKLVSERIVALTKPLTDAVPILEPLLQAFVEAADKTVQDRLGRSYDRVIEAALQEPRRLETIVEQEAKAVVADADVRTPVDRATPLARRQVEAQKQRRSALSANSALIHHRVAEHLEYLERRERAARERAARESKDASSRPEKLRLIPLEPLQPRLPLELSMPYRPYTYYPPSYRSWSYQYTPPKPLLRYRAPVPRVPRFFFFW